MMKVKRQKLKVIRLTRAALLILFTFSLSLFNYHKVSAAVLFSQAANQDTYEGQTFVVDWYFDTENQSINVLDLNLNYSKETLEVSEINAGSSLLNLWIKNPIADNQNGTIKLTGGITSGIKSAKVPIFHTVFRAKAAGTAFINLDPSSQILLNDGRGSTAQLKFKNEAFNIYPKDFIPVKITSRSHPDSNVWYKNRDVFISFESQRDTQYSYSFSSNIELVPDNGAMDVPTEIAYPGRPDGIYYFKLNSKKGSNAWQEAGVYRVQIDTTPPEEFISEIGTDPNMFDTRPFISFSTVDKMSGISHYKIKLGAFNIRNSVISPYVLPKTVIGKTLEVTAYDFAGNTRTEKINYDRGISLALFYIILAGLGLIILFLIQTVRNKKKK